MYTVPHCTYSPCVRMSVCLSVCMLILNLITDHPKTPQLLTYSGDDEWEKGGAVLGGEVIILTLNRHLGMVAILLGRIK